MNQAQAKKRIEKLKELINEYRYLYHVKNESIMSEEAADSLKHELANLENQYPDLITPDSPTQRVAGEVLKAFNSVEHEQRMLSLNDVFNVKEIEAWVERITKLLGKAPDTYFEDVKMDGLAMSLIYENGKLIQGLTRGDGYRGEDVTLNIKTIESIPLKLRESESTKKYLSGRTEVRGEIVMYKKDFEELNKKRESEGLPLFANPRNTAAGTIRQLDSKLVSERKLYFRSYDLFIENE
ncbi:MAG: NAD-dependent DNA ligase LigA, partial [bacterium]